MSEPTAEFPIVTEKHFPHGVRCWECSRILPNGTPYKNQIIIPGDLEANPQTFAEHIASAGVGHHICVYCGLDDS